MNSNQPNGDDRKDVKSGLSKREMVLITAMVAILLVVTGLKVFK